MKFEKANSKEGLIEKQNVIVSVVNFVVWGNRSWRHMNLQFPVFSSQ
ncbi:hypothetical protein SLEP1_g39109 [Rubroshorea leprosula]|uniref:Uncharacterized protein n=1 Tax=Rubroshorea leprosula TaxID=152421 RepID=A0AAV5L0A1_9ROSI|nr:hypothetical protein SLEP1_g39109 [Rubroshorea leprosula]